MDWLKEHAFGTHKTQSACGDCVEQKVGVRFIFDDDRTAMLFKLTWA